MLPRRRTLTLLVVLCLGHVLLISSQVPAASGTSALGSAAFGSVTRVQSAIGGLSGGVGGFWQHYLALGGVARDNEALRARVLELEGQLQGERARGTRVDALENALKMQRSVVAPTLAARVIAGNPVTGVLTVNIDRGTADGVERNMAVINDRGLVGRVIGNPSARAATVQLLIDRTAAAGALLEPSAANTAPATPVATGAAAAPASAGAAPAGAALVTAPSAPSAAVPATVAGAAGGVTGGFADGNLRLGLLSSAANVAVGDRVVTSGQDLMFPYGFLIGTVQQVKGTGKAREVVVAPAVNFERIDMVLVVLAKPAPPAPPPIPVKGRQP